MYEVLESKIRHSVDLLKYGEELALKMNPEGYYLAFSGGKDSQVIYHLAKMAGIKFKAFYAPTTIDPAELVTFIKRNYPDVIFEKPKKSFVDVIHSEKKLPYFNSRSCCRFLKEGYGAGNVKILGIRHEESIKRSKRLEVSIGLRMHERSKKDRIIVREREREM